MIEEGEAGERVDRVLAARLVGETLSRSALAQLCDDGKIQIDGKTVRPSQRVRTGSQVTVEVPPNEPLTARPEAIDLSVLYEDAALLVLDKPAGRVVHPSRGHTTGTLVNAVLHHVQVEDDAQPLRPGIVHRLDKDTSGVMVVAKTAAAREALKLQFQNHTIERAYTAITVGSVPDTLTFETLHGRHPTDRLRFSGRVTEGRRAVTHVVRLEAFPSWGATLVRCTLETGRTHQIRMHLSEGGYPILGDPLYGRTPPLVPLRVLGEQLGRQALHASVLGFVHPVTRETVRFESALPADIAATLATLRVPRA